MPEETVLQPHGAPLNIDVAETEDADFMCIFNNCFFWSETIFHIAKIFNLCII